MAPFGQIYTYPGSWKAQYCQVAAAFGNLEVPYADFDFGKERASPEFRAKFPLGKVPAFEAFGPDASNPSEGALYLTESLAIAQYLALKGDKPDQLLGFTAEQKAVVAMWTTFSDSELASYLLYPIVMAAWRMYDWDEARYHNDVGRLARALDRLELELEARQEAGRATLCGDDDKVTLADITVAGNLIWGYKFLLDPEWRGKLPATTKYVEGMLALPEFKGVHPDVKYCERSPLLGMLESLEEKKE